MLKLKNLLDEKSVKVKLQGKWKHNALPDMSYKDVYAIVDKFDEKKRKYDQVYWKDYDLKKTQKHFKKMGKKYGDIQLIKVDTKGKMIQLEALNYANDENEAVGNFLLKHRDGKKILSKVMNSRYPKARDLEKLVMKYHKTRGIPNWEFEDDDDEGIDWVTFSDLLKTLQSNESIDESGLMYRAGVKRYGKEGMTKIQSAAGKGAGHAEIGKIKDQYDKKKKKKKNEYSHKKKKKKKYEALDPYKDFGTDNSWEKEYDLNLGSFVEHYQTFIKFMKKYKEVPDKNKRAWAHAIRKKVGQGMFNGHMSQMRNVMGLFKDGEKFRKLPDKAGWVYENEKSTKLGDLIPEKVSGKKFKVKNGWSGNNSQEEDFFDDVEWELWRMFGDKKDPWNTQDKVKQQVNDFIVSIFDVMDSDEWLDKYTGLNQKAILKYAKSKGLKPIRKPIK